MSAPAKSRANTSHPGARRPRRGWSPADAMTEPIAAPTERIPLIIDELTQELPAVGPRYRRREDVYLYGLDALRMVAALIIVFAHINLWYLASHQTWPAQRALDVLTGPLQTPIDFVGLAAFFLISGVVITQVGLALPPGRFLVRRAVRITPALWAGVILSWLLLNGHAMTAEGGASSAGLNSLLSNMFLANYATPNTVTVLPVTWTLLVEIAFYLFMAATMRLMRTRPWLVPAIGAAALSVGLSVVHVETPPILHVVRVILTYLPILFLGQLIGLVRARRLHPLAAIGYGGLFYLLFLRADLTSSFTPGVPDYERELILALLVVVLLTKANGRFVRSRWITAVSLRTYAVYLVHLPVMYAVLGQLAPRLGSTPATLIGLVGVALTAEALYRFVEYPAERLYRRWEKARRARAEASQHDDSQDRTKAGADARAEVADGSR
ncbi:MAG TPA: acyltransferase [Pseudonocardiaceae bacterium]|nr:acyltransferase [Pseudonocardiaceae bacterium]